MDKIPKIDDSEVNAWLNMALADTSVSPEEILEAFDQSYFGEAPQPPWRIKRVKPRPTT